jgi:hypothetical protein
VVVVVEVGVESVLDVLVGCVEDVVVVLVEVVLVETVVVVIGGPRVVVLDGVSDVVLLDASVVVVEDDDVVVVGGATTWRTSCGPPLGASRASYVTPSAESLSSAKQYTPSPVIAAATSKTATSPGPTGPTLLSTGPRKAG